MKIERVGKLAIRSNLTTRSLNFMRPIENLIASFKAMEDAQKERKRKKRTAIYQQVPLIAIHAAPRKLRRHRNSRRTDCIEEKRTRKAASKQ